MGEIKRERLRIHSVIRGQRNKRIARACGGKGWCTPTMLFCVMNNEE